MNTKPAVNFPDEPSYKMLHRAFEIGLLLKGLNAAAEIIGAVLLLLVPYETLQSLIAQVAGHAAGWKFGDGWHDMLVKLGLGIAPDMRLFFIWYFLSHGIVKSFVVLCLFKGWRWAYPLAIAVLLAFIAFQVFEMLGGHHLGMYIALTIFDFLIIALTVNEWRHSRKLAHYKLGQAKPAV